jgi:exodeoxyribonuclease III
MKKTQKKSPDGTLKVATFNANSVRSRLPIVLAWLKKEKPDVLALQETKVQDHEFPKSAFTDLGWNVIFRGQKAYNGVALVSKEPLHDVVDRLYPKENEESARFISAVCKGVRIVNTYIPQGHTIDSEKYQFKLKYFADLKAWFDKNVPDEKPALWVGDLNIAPTDIDVDNPDSKRDHVCFHLDARMAFLKARDPKWTDLFRKRHPEPGHYTFWDYRFPSSFAANKGWRIDHILGTKPMAGRLERIWVDKEPRKAEKPSDHTFLVATFSE